MPLPAGTAVLPQTRTLGSPALPELFKKLSEPSARQSVATQKPLRAGRGAKAGGRVTGSAPYGVKGSGKPSGSEVCGRIAKPVRQHQRPVFDTVATTLVTSNITTTSRYRLDVNGRGGGGGGGAE